MKNGVESYKDFFGYFNALKTNCVATSLDRVKVSEILGSCTACLTNYQWLRPWFKLKVVILIWNSKFGSGDLWNHVDCGEHLNCRRKWENLQCVTKRFSPNYLMVDELTWRVELHRPFKYVHVHSRRPEGSTNRAYPSCFNFRTSSILMEQPYFFKIVPSVFCRAFESKHTLRSQIEEYS